MRHCRRRIQAYLGYRHYNFFEQSPERQCENVANRRHYCSITSKITFVRYRMSGSVICSNEKIEKLPAWSGPFHPHYKWRNIASTTVSVLHHRWSHYCVCWFSHTEHSICSFIAINICVVLGRARSSSELYFKILNEATTVDGRDNLSHNAVI